MKLPPASSGWCPSSQVHSPPYTPAHLQIRPASATVPSPTLAVPDPPQEDLARQDDLRPPHQLWVSQGGQSAAGLRPCCPNSSLPGHVLPVRSGALASQGKRARKAFFPPMKPKLGQAGAVRSRAQDLLLLSTGSIGGGQKMPTSPLLLLAITHPSAFTPRSRQGHGQRSSAPAGHRHSSAIPCKLTRCLVAVPCLCPCLPLLQDRVLWQQCSRAPVSAGAGSPAVSAPHVLLCISGHELLTSPAQAGLAHCVPWQRGGLAHWVPETSHSCPSSQRSRSSSPSHAGAGQHTPSQTTPQSPIKAIGDKKSNRPKKGH